MGAAVVPLTVAATGFQLFNQYRQGAEANRVAQVNSRRILQTAQFNAGMLRRQSEIFAAVTTKAGEYNAAIAGNNAVILENAAIVSMQDAQRSRQQSQYEADRIRDINKRFKGRQIAAIAKSGILLEGTPSDVIFDSAIQGELDALASEYIGNIEERQFLIDAVNKRYSATQSRHRGSVILAESRNNANIALWEGDTRSRILLNEAFLQSSGLLAQGRSALKQSFWNMAGTLLTAGTNIVGDNPGFFNRTRRVGPGSIPANVGSFGGGNIPQRFRRRPATIELFA